MNRVFELNDLTESIECLFLSGADGEHDEDDMLDLLEGIDWKALYQVLLLQGRRVYEFIAGGEASSRMNYRSRDLFGQRAVCLDEDIQFPQNTAEDNQVNTYSYELWLLEDCHLLLPHEDRRRNLSLGIPDDQVVRLAGNRNGHQLLLCCGCSGEPLQSGEKPRLSADRGLIQEGQ